jgi:hypothetical protein
VASIARDGEIVSVHHGLFVEVRDHFFIEGVWNGPFDKGNFASTDCVFGTGAVLRKRSVLFVSSASTTDYLYYHQSAEYVVVSNSLPLLLSYTEDSLDPHFTGYPAINDSIIEGINDHIRDIPTLKGSVKRLMYRNLEISARSVIETEKDMPPNFACYNDYYAYLVNNYQLIVDNIRDPSRKFRLQIFSTQSKGYDSTALNTIAAKFGIDNVFTIIKGKSPKHFATRDQNTQVDDDGSPICNALGLNFVPIDRRSFAREFDQEYLYYAALHYNQDANFNEIMTYVSDVSVILTGTLGEIWYTNQSYYKDRPGDINPDLKRGDHGGHGLSELRLVVGFIHLPFVYIGARRREDIFRITESPEMGPWRLENSYDRPIPRRIAEEAGVPRDLFGQIKVGSVVLFPSPSLPYGRELREEFLESLINEGIMTRWGIQLWPLVHLVNSVIAFRYNYRAVYYLERLISKIIRREFVFDLLWKHLDGSLFCFCVNKCVHDYASCFREKDCITSDRLVAMSEYYERSSELDRMS